jgi:hypothetical protein
VAQLTQLTSLVLGYNVVATYKAPLSSLITVPSKMVNLQSLAVEFAPEYTAADDDKLGPVNLEQNSVWEPLSNTDLQHLLTSYLALTTLTFKGMVLDQAGLDLLLAHPHIVNVTLLAIAATESRVDSPCSWQTLYLARQVDVRAVAYVPLHSLTNPLPISSLLLPPHTATDQLPRLLQAATTRMAAHKHQFALRQPGTLIIEDLSADLPGPAPGEAPAAGRWTPDVITALFQATAPLAACNRITGKGFQYRAFCL